MDEFPKSKRGVTDSTATKGNNLNSTKQLASDTSIVVQLGEKFRAERVKELKAAIEYQEKIIR